MGEHARFEGQMIKIGTCEDLYYLRYDQAHLVQALSNNVDPVKEREEVRFRFPFPWEDGIKPGQFESHNPGIGVWGVTAPAEVEHYTVQFRAEAGYLVSLPCPESPDYHTMQTPYGSERSEHGSDAFQVSRNGFSGAVKIVQQRCYEGRLVTVCQCGGCGTKYRLPTIEDAQPIIEALLKADEPYKRVIAERIAAGYLIQC